MPFRSKQGFLAFAVIFIGAVVLLIQTGHDRYLRTWPYVIFMLLIALPLALWDPKKTRKR